MRIRKTLARPAPGIGFSLLEVLVAIAIISVAVTAGAQLIGMAVAANARARRVTRAAILAAQKLEELRGARFAVDDEGAVFADGRLADAPPGALATDTAGYCDYFNGFGEPVPGGPPRPAGAAIVRRWTVAPAEPMPDELLAIQVVVVAAGVGPPDASFTTIRARRDE